MGTTVVMLLLLVFVGLPCCLSQTQMAAEKETLVTKAALKCLQLDKCTGQHGYCFNSLTARPVCDAIVSGLCSLQDLSPCQCCVRCSEKPCLRVAATTACRRECKENEFANTKCNSYCQCCQTCEPTKCGGRCVSHPDLCGKAEEYIEGVCEGDKCTCCVTCKPDLGCEKSGGQCVNVDEECPCGTWPSPYFGCNNGSKKCKCCTPCPPSETCSAGPEMGRCVPDKPYCNGHDEYISDMVCCQGACSCCKTCEPDKTCQAENGKCFKTEIGCGAGMVRSTRGNCSSDNCVCCVPELCPLSCNCTEGANPGRCVAKPFIIKYNEYPSQERCIGRACSCYKTCTPDPLCSAVKGTCFTARTGCRGDLVVSGMGHCNSKDCLCCVQKPCLPTKECYYLNDPGRCETDERRCSSVGEYISKETPCEGTDCFCCKTCQPDLSCEKVNGTCFEAQQGCGLGFIKSEVGRCKNPENCVCCEKDIRCQSSQACSYDGDTGRCETEKEKCSSVREYINELTPCKGEGCFCCKTCQPDLSCEKVRGTCFEAQQGCGLGLIKSEVGRCKNPENCVCCEPPIKCLLTQECSSDGDPGRCETEKENCSSLGEYIYELTPCKGEGCFCCKTCQADLSCEQLKGKCFVARDGCPSGLVPTKEGRCKNNLTCACCVHDLSQG